LHLGNYLGALRQWVKLQDEMECFFCVVDLHALTVRQEPAELRARCRELAAMYLACGIDSQKSVIFIQSHVPEHSQLNWLLSTFTYMGELEKMTQFKDKSKRHNENVNAGLFTYPVLMAADILLYDAARVPVGEDQKQHLELCRNIAIRMNNALRPPDATPVATGPGAATYSSLFVVPEPMIPPTGARIMDLQNPDRKMSKSEQPAGTIYLTDAPDVIRKKCRRAVTDSLNNIAFDPVGQQGVANLLSIIAATNPDGMIPAAVAESFAGKGYGALKDACADAIIAALEPIQKRYAEVNRPELLDPVLREGAARAREVAGETLDRVHDALGLLPN